jgi:hypothetical protein
MAQDFEAITVQFKRETAKQLREIARQENRSMSQQIRHLVEAGFAAEYEAGDAAA